MGKDLKGKNLGKGVSQRKDGRYIARFTNKFGQRKTFYDFKISVVKKWLNDAKYEDEHGINGDGISITLNEWYITWSELYKKKTCKRTTIYKNDSYYNARVKDTLGVMFLKDIKLVHVQKFVNNLLDNGLSHGTVANIRFLLNGIFDKAVINDYMQKNPCIGLELPKATKNEKRVLILEEQKVFFNIASNYTHINVLKLLITTGCRIGEALALKWEDIDFENRTISINKTIHYSKAIASNGSKFFYTTPKTSDSLRTIPITEEVYTILKNQKVRQDKQKSLKGKMWKQHKEFENLVFTCGEGNPIYYSNINEAIKEYVEKINIIDVAQAQEEDREPNLFKPFTCHTLRHTYATRCYENEISPRVVQKLLGHAKMEMTDYYTHVSEEKKIEEIIDLKILV